MNWREAPIAVANCRVVRIAAGWPVGGTMLPEAEDLGKGPLGRGLSVLRHR